MTRAEFIAAWINRSEGDDLHATATGVSLEPGGQDVKVALPCECDYDGCEGWAMIPPVGVEWHMSRLSSAAREKVNA